jgi:predicted nucleotidyltransferase
MTEALQKALKIIIEVADPDKVILFGSRARGDDSTDSDYDILVLKKGVKNNRKLAQKIYLNFINVGAPVDVLVYDTEKYNEMKDYPFKIYYTINLEGQVIYEKAG